MYDIFIILKILLVTIGSVFLAFSLLPIRNVANQFSKGTLKLKWNILSFLILSFIVSYIYYIYDLFLNYEIHDKNGFVVPLIFFFGAIFVLLVGALASQTARDIRKIAVLHHESITDSLMNISNRRFFDKRLEEEVSIALRYKLSLSLIMIDIDDFKIVNDTYGHQAGDAILKELSKNIKSILRESDIIARYGGEEIVVITPSTDKDNAYILAERLRVVVEKSMQVILEDTKEVVKVTISLGLASIRQENIDNSEELVLEADKALYQAKKDGKNKVCLSNK